MRNKGAILLGQRKQSWLDGFWGSSGRAGTGVTFFFFWPCCTVCGILVPQPGIKPVPPAVEV